jgi:hypothetical protein
VTQFVAPSWGKFREERGIHSKWIEAIEDVNIKVQYPPGLLQALHIHGFASPKEETNSRRTTYQKKGKNVPSRYTFYNFSPPILTKISG